MQDFFHFHTKISYVILFCLIILFFTLWCDHPILGWDVLGFVSVSLFSLFPPFYVDLLDGGKWKQSKKSLEIICKWLLLSFSSFYSSHTGSTQIKKNLSLGGMRMHTWNSGTSSSRPGWTRTDALAYSSISFVLKQFDMEVERAPLQVASSPEHIIKKIHSFFFFFLPKWDYSIQATL